MRNRAPRCLGNLSNNSMKIHEQYPSLKPYKGSRFGLNAKPALLLVGESHYLPKGSLVLRSADKWYAGDDSMLNDGDRQFLHTAGVIETFLGEKKLNKAYTIWKNAFQVINEFGPKYEDPKRVGEEIAFCNFFLRPAIYGGSLKGEIHPVDVEIANEALNEIIEELQPTAIIFLSVLAHSYCHKPLPVQQAIEVPHPGCRHWNRRAKKYGGRNGRERLGEFVTTLNWNGTSPTSDSALIKH